MTNYGGSITVHISGYNMADRGKEFLGFLRQETATFASITVSGLAVSELISTAAGSSPSLASTLIPAIGFAVAASLYRAHSRFKAHVPTSLSNETELAQEIARRKRFGWQWALAREMLLHRIRSLDAEMSRMTSGSEFILPRHLREDEYYSWLRRRPNAIIRLSSAAMIQITSEVPQAIGNTKNDSDISQMRIAIDGLTALYRAAVDFEHDCRAIVPPQEFESVHEVTILWTDPIRAAIREFVEFLARVSEIKEGQIEAGGVDPPALHIKLEAHRNVQEFDARLQKLAANV